MTSWQPIRPDELDEAGSAYDGASGSDALRMARELESASILDPVQPGAGFVDSVMAAIEQEPAPDAALAIVGPIRRRGPRGIVESVRAAIAMITLGAGRPLAARAMALAYLVAVGALVLGLSGGAAVGAAGVLGLLEDRGPEPTPIVLPSPSRSPDASGDLSTRGPSASPSGSTVPSESPEASDDPTASPSGSPGASARPTRSPSPSPSADESESPGPSETPEASGTPKASDTPEPSGTPNSSG